MRYFTRRVELKTFLHSLTVITSGMSGIGEAPQDMFFNEFWSCVLIVKEATTSHI